jgi:hypothetical protein
MKSQPVLVKTKPWTEISFFFTNLAASNSYFSVMDQFVLKIANSKYASGLFATNSMHDLWISQIEEFEMGHEVLVVQFDGFKNAFSFEYHEHPNAKKHWSRECKIEEVFKVFERFLEVKKWFLEI